MYRSMDCWEKRKNLTALQTFWRHRFIAIEKLDLKSREKKDVGVAKCMNEYIAFIYGSVLRANAILKRWNKRKNEWERNKNLSWVCNYSHHKLKFLNILVNGNGICSLCGGCRNTYSFFILVISFIKQKT